MLVIEAVELVPKKQVRIAPFDQVKIVVDPTTTKLDNPISGMFQVDSSGEVVFGPAYDAFKISGLHPQRSGRSRHYPFESDIEGPISFARHRRGRLEKGIKGEHVVSADGSIALGAYGSVEVEGLTIAQAREAIERQLSDFFACLKLPCK